MPQYSHWHYILGYLIITSAHNWPVLLALAACGHSAYRLYRTPTRRNVRALYGWALLVFAYEYVKHLGAYLAEPVRFLFTTDWAWMDTAGVFVIERAVPIAIVLLALALLLGAARDPKESNMRRGAHGSPHLTAE